MRFCDGSLAVADAKLGDYTTGTNIGLHLMSVVAALELELISRETALEMVRRELDSLQRLETYHGFAYNFYDTTTLERTTHFVSFVDSAWLVAGLVVTRQAFPEVYEACSALITAKDFAFFYDTESHLMVHGFRTNPGGRSSLHYGVLYTEARVGSLLAIGKGDVPEEHWFRMQRTFPPEATWQSRKPQGRRPKSVLGYPVMGGWYEWQGMRYVPSWGGSMFEALMPLLVLDEEQVAPRSLGRNGRGARIAPAPLRDRDARLSGLGHVAEHDPRLHRLRRVRRPGPGHPRLRGRRGGPVRFRPRPGGGARGRSRQPARAGRAV